MLGLVRDATSLGRDIRGKTTADAVIVRLAAQQHGVVARRQLVEAGVSRYAVDRRIQRGLLHVVYRGVFAVGHRSLTREGRWMAAVVAAGKRAVLSHRSAGALWQMLRWPYAEVTAPSRHRRPGIRIHCSRLPADEVTERSGIPTTTVPRTLLDLATVLRSSQVERAINEAEIQRLTDPLSLPDLLDRYPGRRGTPAIRAILTRLQSGAQITRSELEVRFLEFARGAGLPPPEVNAWLQIKGEWLECDCVWRSRRVVVELDGRATHGTAAAFERDRARDRRLHAAGWRTVRITWQQLQAEAQALAEDVRAVLGRLSL